MVQYIEHIFQQLVGVSLDVVMRYVGKWLVWFCLGLVCLSKKTKSTICGLVSSPNDNVWRLA